MKANPQYTRGSVNTRRPLVARLSIVVPGAWLCCALALLGGCQSGPTAPTSRTPQQDSGPTRIPSGVLTQPDPTPRDEPLSASGNSLSYVVFGRKYFRLASAQGFDEQGVASWYGKKFHGRLTASGERYDMYSMTAAHKSLPLPTYVRVTNLKNNRSVVVRVNDRGPFVDDRLIDLSYAAAAKLDMLTNGTAPVRVVALSGVPGERTASPSVAIQTATQSAPLPYTVPQPILSGPTVATDAPATASVAPGTVLAQRSSPTEAPSLSGGSYLQLGAFASYDAAGEMLQRVQGAVPVNVFVAKQSNSELYRVQAGPIESDQRLAEIRASLLERFAIEAIPLQRDETSTACC